MFYEYNGYYFKLKSLRDYQYLSMAELSEFKWSLTKNLYNYLKQHNKLELYNELTSLSIKQQNELIMLAIPLPKSYLQIYTEKQ